VGPQAEGWHRKARTGRAPRAAAEEACTARPARATELAPEEPPAAACTAVAASAASAAASAASAASATASAALVAASAAWVRPASVAWAAAASMAAAASAAAVAPSAARPAVAWAQAARHRETSATMPGSGSPRPERSPMECPLPAQPREAPGCPVAVPKRQGRPQGAVSCPDASTAPAPERRPKALLRDTPRWASSRCRGHRPAARQSTTRQS
jgi:hypothetical protein